MNAQQLYEEVAAFEYKLEGVLANLRGDMVLGCRGMVMLSRTQSMNLAKESLNRIRQLLKDIKAAMTTDHKQEIRDALTELDVLKREYAELGVEE